jgi:Fe2+ or Zn2+ uptake regulation protein
LPIYRQGNLPIFSKNGYYMLMNQNIIIEKLSEKNIRPSLQRMAVYGFLAENPIHPTVDTIYQALHPEIPTLSKTTVYNTLKQLVDCGLVQTVTIEDGELRFDADISNHLHFKCTKCGEVFDVFKEINLPEDLLPEGFAISKMQTNLWGLCANCN